MTRTLTIVFLLFLAPAVFAQQRPLVTEDPETIGDKRMLIEAGIEYARDVEYPLSGLTGHLRRFPLIGISIGIGEIGEVQIDGGLYNRLAITERGAGPLSHMLTATGDSTWSIEAAAERVERERPRPRHAGLLLVAARRQDRAVGPRRRQHRPRHSRRPDPWRSAE
jgi:hypothetical protein